MKFPASIDNFPAPSSIKRALHLAIGIFDGVHRGHRTVIESAVFQSRSSKGISGVLTFNPHPSRLLRSEDPTRLIMPLEAKTKMLHKIGVDLVIRKKFDEAFSSIPAGNFLAELKNALPTLVSIYVGENFSFGQRRLGNVSTLIKSGSELGLKVVSAKRIKHNGEPISSTRIRKSINLGEINLANDLLGYNYTTMGKIVEGAKLGRQIGFPTLNLPWAPESLPSFGVYYVHFRSHIKENWQPGIANYGVKPTVAKSDQTPILEIHALRGTKLDSGDTIEVEWLSFLRPEKKFDGLKSLKEQITRDCNFALKLAKN